MAAQTFEFNAPQFVDFSVGLDDSDGADTFFDVESETPKKENDPKDDRNVLSSEKKDSDSMEQRKIIKAFRRLSGVTNNTTEKKSPLKDISNFGEKYKGSHKKEEKPSVFDGIVVNKKDEKLHNMITRGDKGAQMPPLELRSRVILKDEEKMVLRDEEKALKRKSMYQLQDPSRKYIGLAEKIFHFQKDTPPRFHSSRKRSSGGRGSLFQARKSYRPRRTIAITPKLVTSSRSRPVTTLSQQQIEEQQIEEMKKHQVKAMPLNENVLKPPKPLRMSTKPPTVQEPFKITDVFKKPAPKLEAQPYVFTANPVPKKILERPVGLGPRPEIPITVPQSPAITKSARAQRPLRVIAISNDNKMINEEVLGYGVPFSKFTAPKKTAVQPFSFETRDKEMQERKEKKIQEIFEAEKKAREFKANPLPKFASHEVKGLRHSHLDCSKTSITSAMEDIQYPFKAKSPKVLRQEPFKPHLGHTHSQPLDITLNTERRLMERRQFELKQREKEDQNAWLKEEMALQKKMKEEEEIARLRQETVHKAQPMPKFKQPPKLQKSTIPLTEAKSPRFSKRGHSTPLK